MNGKSQSATGNISLLKNDNRGSFKQVFLGNFELMVTTNLQSYLKVKQDGRKLLSRDPSF